MKIPQGRQAHLLGFVVLKHDTQLRKYTNEPYHTHVRAVADMANHKCLYGYEIGLCHDLFEDTDTNWKCLNEALLRFGYTNTESEFICNCVHDLTDQFTSESYPKLNRNARKRLEAERLHLICAPSQTVKYCDLIHNTSSIVEFDKVFAKKYIPEKEYILSGMKNGNRDLYKLAMQSLHQAKKELELV